MNILYLAHRIPYPPNKGDKIRSYHQVAHLAKRHRVWCAFFVDAAEDWGHVETLKRLCQDVVAIPLHRGWARVRGAARLALGGTATEGYFDDGRLRRALRRWSSEVAFDAALVYSSSMAPYAMEVRARRRVLDLCDLDSRKFAAYAAWTDGLGNLAYRAEANRLRSREERWLETFDACTVVTRDEADALAPATGGRLHVVCNGVDAGPEPRRRSNEAEPVVGFVGQMDYKPNVDAVCWFAHRVWPAVRVRHRSARFEIVGRSPVSAVQRLGDLDGVCVVGGVDDVRARVERFAVSVAPLRMGWGIQNKVLEAMAAGRPVVATSVAAAGIDAVSGEHLLIDDEVLVMADRINELVADPARRAMMGEAARLRVIDRHRWEREMATLERLLIGETAGEGRELNRQFEGAALLA